MGDIKKNLKSLRAKLGMTQEEFAKNIKIPVSTYIKKENGQTQFTLEEVYRICKFSKKTVEEIFFAN